jgi:uncharacterized protein YceK
MMRLVFVVFLGLALLSGCGPIGPEPGPGGVSADDAKQLDAAAAKVDARSSTETAASIADDPAPSEKSNQR